MWAATCGETSLAVHDVVTGEVVLKYRHPEREDFYCVAATVALGAGAGAGAVAGAGAGAVVVRKRQAAAAEMWRLPVLAVAGGAGTIKLVSPAHRACYAELRAHRKNINALAFAPGMPRRLFSGSSDATAIAWDIGTLDLAEAPK